MDYYVTKYGELKDVQSPVFYEDGSLKECSLNFLLCLSTPYGILVPQYTINYRKRNNISCSFYRSGTLKKLALEDQTEIPTPVGALPAELVTFYPNGSIKRLFPLNGQLSGYWDEADEYKLATKIPLSLSIGDINAALLTIGFYENGVIKSLTLWPNEEIEARTPLGKIKARIGVSFYPNGNLKSLEPARPTKIFTPIGSFLAFDNNACGISGDTNSLTFTEDGILCAFATSNHTIEVIDLEKNAHRYTPQQFLDPEDGELFAQPVKISFFQNQIIINDKESYDIASSEFVIKPFLQLPISQCCNCSTCGANCKSLYSHSKIISSDDITD
ncbi:MAG: repeat protein [Herbinix sp.]|jgi:antitoxin component YwqK of YwqJK toxin-antitoxin module|nr:repeat protein [Herbinix sp.]